MVDNNSAKRRPGRPLAFDPDTALDQAVLTFWQLGYDGADTKTLARAMGITKPSIYGSFGTKEQLFVKALQRYSETIGSAPIRAFADAPNVTKGVAAFFDALVDLVSGCHGPTGCLYACVASQCAAEMPNVATFTHDSLAATDNALADLFSSAVKEGSLPPDFPVKERARLMADFMQGLSLRARAGFSQQDLKAATNAAADAVLRN
jgi:AcrR family transcriptional regulator